MTKGLFINQSSVVSGAETVLINLIKNLSEIDFDLEPIVATPSEGLLNDRIRDMGIRAVTIPFPMIYRTRNPIRLASFLLGYMKSGWKLLKLLQYEKIDFIHINHFRCLLTLRLIHWAYPVNVVWHVHDIFDCYWLNKLLLKWGTRSVNTLICVSQAVRKNMIDLGISGSKCQVIYNFGPVKLPSKPKTNLRKELGLSSNTPIVGCIGQLAEWKGQDVFVEAAQITSQSIKKVNFVIIGDIVDNKEVGYRTKILRTIEDAKQTCEIHWLGFKPNILQLISQIDIVVHSSNKSDPLPTVIIEAMSQNRVVVGTNVGGVPELIDHNKTGLVVPKQDPHSLSNAIKWLLENPQIAIDMGNAGRTKLDTLQNTDETLLFWKSIYIGCSQ